MTRLAWSCDEFLLILGEGAEIHGSSSPQRSWWTLTKATYSSEFARAISRISLNQTKRYNSDVNDTWIEVTRNATYYYIRFSPTEILGTNIYIERDDITYTNVGYLAAGLYQTGEIEVDYGFNLRCFSNFVGEMQPGVEYDFPSDVNYGWLTSPNITWEDAGFYEYQGNMYRVNVTADPTYGGTVTGGGLIPYGNGFTIEATPNSLYSFEGWIDVLNKNIISTNRTYSETPVSPKQQYNFKAIFVDNFKYRVDVTCNIANAFVDGGGSFGVGTAFSLTTTNPDYKKYTFLGWRNNDTNKIESKSYKYGYTVSSQKYLSYTAIYQSKGYVPSTNPSDLDNDDITDGKPTGWMQHGDTGMFAIFNPTQAQMDSLAQWLYSPSFWQAVIGQGLADIDLTSIIISLSVLPVSISSSGTKNIKVGWFAPTSVIPISYTNSNYVEINCGSLTVNGIYNGALDYQTQVEIYLPYIGYKPLETYDAINHSITPIYQVDLMTGDCICKIKIGDSIKYQFTGNCAYSIPLSQVNSNGVVSKGISGAIAAASLTAGLMGHPLMATTGGAVTTGGTTTKTTKINRGMSGAVTSRKVTEDVSGGSRTYKSPIINAKEVIGTFTNMGNGIHHGGSLHGNTGYMAINKPFLNIIRPRLDIPDDFGRHNGYPCNKSLTLGSLNGFTMVDEIHMTGFSCTDSELTEIEQLLTGGVIL